MIIIISDCVGKEHKDVFSLNAFCGLCGDDGPHRHKLPKLLLRIKLQLYIRKKINNTKEESRLYILTFVSTREKNDDYYY